MINPTLFLSPRSALLSTSEKMNAGVMRDAAETYKHPTAYSMNI